MILGWVQGTNNHYPITQEEGGVIFCPCEGFKWRKRCKHLDAFNKGDYSVETKFRLTLGDKVFEGETRLDPHNVTIEEVTDKLWRTEDFLKKLLGVEVKIEQVL